MSIEMVKLIIVLQRFAFWAIPRIVVLIAIYFVVKKLLKMFSIRECEIPGSVPGVSLDSHIPQWNVGGLCMHNMTRYTAS